MPNSKTYDVRGVKTVRGRSTGYEKLRYSVVLRAGIFKDKEEYKVFELPPMIIFRNLQKAPIGTFPGGMAVTGTRGGTMTKVLMVEEFLEKVLDSRPVGHSLVIQRHC